MDDAAIELALSRILITKVSVSSSASLQWAEAKASMSRVRPRCPLIAWFSLKAWESRQPDHLGTHPYPLGVCETF